MIVLQVLAVVASAIFALFMVFWGLSVTAERSLNWLDMFRHPKWWKEPAYWTIGASYAVASLGLAASFVAAVAATVFGLW